MNKKKWPTIAAVVLALIEAFSFYRIYSAGVIPGKYMAVIGIVFVLFFLLSFFLLRAGGKRGGGRRVFSIIFAVIIAVVSGVAAHAAGQYSDMIGTITSNDDTTSAVLGVYVLKSDPAKNIKAAKNYTFGYATNESSENISYARKDIKKATGKKIDTKKTGDFSKTIDALYNKDVKVIIMNEAYIDAMGSTNAHKDFKDKTREIYRINVPMKSSAKNASISKPFVVYLSGSDTRSKHLDVSRSDVNIIAVVNPEDRKILFVNTPRDYYIANPAGNGALDKLTHCGIYGIDCSMKALSNLYGTDIDYYAQINFTGFETLIDEIGGVDINVPQAFSAGGYQFSAGEQHMDGKKALVFARERHSFEGGDNERGKNQMRVLTATVNKLTSNKSELLTNYSGIMKSLKGMFITNLSDTQISALVRNQLNDPKSWSVESYAVTGTGGMNTTYSMPGTQLYVMYPDQSTVKTAKSKIKDTMK